MFELSKTAPNGAQLTNHRIHRLEISPEGNYIVTVNSYNTEDVSGIISWQDTYIIEPETPLVTYSIVEQLLQQHM